VRKERPWVPIALLTLDACLWAQGSLGEAVLPVESGSGARDADTDVTVRIVPQQSGIYYYHVQIEDEQGRRSNVLDGTRHVTREGLNRRAAIAREIRSSCQPT